MPAAEHTRSVPDGPGHATPPLTAKPVAGKPNAAIPIKGCPPGEHDVRAWKRIDPSAVTSEQHSRLGNSLCSWSVSVREGKVIATEHEDVTVGPPLAFAVPDTWGPPRVVARAGAGVLLGFNRGEWGGALLWYSDDGSVRQTLMMENVVDVVGIDGAFLVFTGLAHLSSERGNAFVLEDAGGRFRVARSVDLKSAPDAVARDTDGTVLVATGRGLVRVTPKLRIERILDAKWSSLYPKNMALGPERTLYIAMRGVIAEVQLGATPPTETWRSPEPLKASGE